MVAAIQIEGLSKVYRVNHDVPRQRGGYRTFREDLTRWAQAPLRRLKRLAGQAAADASGRTEDFWALNDVSFEVQPGEVVGIIGQNGAGKSTLLKILSRITPPSKGRVKMNGRTGSLLEVGTGFHPELTGRENIFMNGSILGMGRSEIRRKFDEIVEFSGVERFIDTPVKRYSSGMQVRLAFAVAAHLEPEILIIDEVLAVGDAFFQKRCLERMEHVGRSGRTILFVSHDLNAIRTLCHRTITLASGRMLRSGPSDQEVAAYLAGLFENSIVPLDRRSDRSGSGAVTLTRIEFADGSGGPLARAVSGEPLRMTMHYSARKLPMMLDVAVSCFTQQGQKIFHIDNHQTGTPILLDQSHGSSQIDIPRLPLAAGEYFLNARIIANGVVADYVQSAACLTVDGGDFFRAGRTTDAHGGMIVLDHGWK